MDLVSASTKIKTSPQAPTKSIAWLAMSVSPPLPSLQSMAALSLTLEAIG